MPPIVHPHRPLPSVVDHWTKPLRDELAKVTAELDRLRALCDAQADLLRNLHADPDRDLLLDRAFGPQPDTEPS